MSTHKTKFFIQCHVALLLLFAVNSVAITDASKVSKDQGRLHQQYAVPQWKQSLGQNNAVFPALDWWQSYGDKNLSALIEKSLQHNPELASIETRIAQATALSKITRADLFPSISVGGQYLYQQYARNQFAFPLPGRTFQSLSTPLQVSYEPDIWGKNLLHYKAAKRQIDAAQFAYQNARIQLSAAVATAYFNAVKLKQMLVLQQQVEKDAAKQLFHTQQLFSAEQVTAQDVSTAKQHALQAVTQTEILQTNLSIAQNQLIALLGESPSQTKELAMTPLSEINLPAKIDTGLPQELLTHRPDVAQIEASMKTADLNIAAARREFLPTIRISGQSGFAAVGLSNVFKWKNISSFLQPILNLPLFNGGSFKQNLKLKKAEYAELLGQYQATIVNAYTEAENSLATVDGNQKIYADILSQQQETTEKASHQRRLFDAGITAEPMWLSSDIEQLESSKLLAQQKAQVLIDTVGLIKALGGGFDATQK